MADKNEKAVISSASQRIAQQVTDNAGKIRYILVAALAVVVVALAAFGLFRRSAREARAASERALFQAQIDSYTKPENDAFAAFAAVAAGYSGSDAAVAAKIYQFAVALRDNDYDAAEKAARDFIGQNPKHDFIPRMRLALGQLLLGGDRIDEARKEIEPLSKMGGATAPEAALTIAQIYEREADSLEGSAREAKLMEARNAYTNITSQAQNRFAYWPQSVVLAAEFSLLMVNDKLMNYKHPEPRTMAIAAGGALPGGVSVAAEDMPAPPEDAMELPEGDEKDLVEFEKEIAQ